MKPSERILAIINELRAVDMNDSPQEEKFYTYETKAIAQYLDELVGTLRYEIKQKWVDMSKSIIDPEI